MRWSGVVALAGLVMASVASRTMAQALVHPNEIRGTISFTNTHPEIRAEIDRTSALGPFHWMIVASSTTEIPELVSHSLATTASRTSLQYSVTVETSAAGIGYRIGPEIYEGWQFAPRRLVTGPLADVTVYPEPSPDAVADIQTCAALLKLAWVDAAGNPFALDAGEISVGQGGRTWAKSVVEAGAFGAQLLVPGRGEEYQVVVTTISGSDVMLDLIRLETRFQETFDCDEVVTRTIECGAGAGGLGRLIGTYDLVGQTEIAFTGPTPGQGFTQIVGSGPFQNVRVDLIEGTGNGPFALENLVPSSAPGFLSPWVLTSMALVVHDGREQIVTTADSDVLIPEGGTVDVGTRLVMTPGFLDVDQVLAGPPPAQSPGGSVLEDATEGTSHNGFNRIRAYGRQEMPQRILTGNTVTLPGGFDAATGELRHSVEVVAASPQATSPAWTTPGLWMQFRDIATPAQPETFRESWLTLINDVAGGSPVAPGAHVATPVHVCFSQLNLAFIDIGGQFRSPLISSTSRGELHGPDFEGNRQDRDVIIVAGGTPRWNDAAAASGLVVTALPEGEYVLRPMVESEDASGNRSWTELRPVHVTAGCRQVIGASPHISVSVAAPVSAPAGPADVTASVDSARPVAAMTWSLNGSPPQPLCAPCGANPLAGFRAPLAAGENVLVVSAVDDSGHGAATTSWVMAEDAPCGEPVIEAARGAGSRVRIAWPGAAPADVFAGSIAALNEGLYDHGSANACGVTSPVEVDAGPGTYFVVAARCPGGRTAVGRDSNGLALPAPAPDCP